jgi:tetratricopeptide (TPR) repeat protein
LVASGAAEQLYRDLENKWPGKPLTEEARFTLATSYLNFCQEKMNFFLDGKGMVHVINLEKGSGLDVTAGATSKTLTGTNKEEITKIKTIVSTDYIKAAAMMKRALSLLKDEPALCQAYLARYEFLNCMALYAQRSNKIAEVLEICNHYIIMDPGSPAGYLLKGWILKDMERDSSKFFFKKAAGIAPKWPYPVNGLGNYYLSESKYDSALLYFNQAIALDSLNSDAYRSRGLVHFIKGGYAGNGGMSRMDQGELESARKDFVQARNLNASDRYAYVYFADHQAIFMQSYGKGNPGYSSYYNNAKNNYLKAINIDSSFALGYKKLSDFFVMTGDTISGLAQLQNFVQHNPGNGEGLRYLGNFYMNMLADTVKAEEAFTKSIQLEPGSSANYFALVRLYKKLGKKEKALAVLNDATLHLFNNKEVYNELGNVYLLEPSQYELASASFQKALDLDSTLDYVYYNLAVLYNAKNGITGAATVNENTIDYYRKALQFNPYRWQKLNHQIADWYYAHQQNLLAREYYQRALAGGNLTKEKDIHQLVSILMAEKNFSEATRMVNLYLTPDQDKSLYSQLMGEINAAAPNH